MGTVAGALRKVCELVEANPDLERTHGLGDLERHLDELKAERDAARRRLEALDGA